MIRDFNAAEGNRIDLRAIDVDAATAGNQAFNLIGGNAFGSEAGELQVRVSDASTLVRDGDGDGAADFAVRLRGSVALQADDFHL